MKQHIIATEFDAFPGTRYRKHGAASAEAFREDFLMKWLAADGEVLLDFRGTLPSQGFINEVFSGLVHVHGMRPQQVRDQVAIEADDPEVEDWAEQTLSAIEDDQRKRGRHGS